MKSDLAQLRLATKTDFDEVRASGDSSSMILKPWRWLLFIFFWMISLGKLCQFLCFKPPKGQHPIRCEIYISQIRIRKALLIPTMSFATKIQQDNSLFSILLWLSPSLHPMVPSCTTNHQGPCKHGDKEERWNNNWSVAKPNWAPACGCLASLVSMLETAGNWWRENRDEKTLDDHGKVMLKMTENNGEWIRMIIEVVVWVCFWWFKTLTGFFWLLYIFEFDLTHPFHCISSFKFWASFQLMQTQDHPKHTRSRRCGGGYRITTGQA